MAGSFTGLAVAVTGGTGWLGTALVDALLHGDAREVRILSRSPSPARDPRVRAVKGDVRDPAAVTALVRGAQGVFHLAGIKDLAYCETNPVDAIETNAFGAYRVCEAVAAEPDIRWAIAASSVKACLPSSVYGWTKALTERAFSAAGLGAVRLSSVWGGPASLAGSWDAQLRANERIEVTDPEMTRTVMTRAQAVEALLGGARRPLRGEVLVPTASAYRLGDLADAYARSHGASLTVVGARAGEKRHEDLAAERPARTREQCLDRLRSRHDRARHLWIRHLDPLVRAELRIPRPR
ncbi:MAG TPA: polysaccharide biosynthesis protein [Candidatus Limnocylindria bacterium]|nr:polysaccharide biosynthesis protein [Candidatus Limnocylindria bacterium]